MFKAVWHICISVNLTGSQWTCNTEKISALENKMYPGLMFKKSLNMYSLWVCSYEMFIKFTNVVTFFPGPTVTVAWEPKLEVVFIQKDHKVRRIWYVELELQFNRWWDVGLTVRALSCL